MGQMHKNHPYAISTHKLVFIEEHAVRMCAPYAYTYQVHTRRSQAWAEYRSKVEWKWKKDTRELNRIAVTQQRIEMLFFPICSWVCFHLNFYY